MAGSIVRGSRRDVSVAIGVSVAVGVMAVRRAVAVLVGHSVRFAVLVRLGTVGAVARVADRQVALHVVLGRRERTVDFAEQTVMRILPLPVTAWSFRTCANERGREGKRVIISARSYLATGSGELQRRGGSGGLHASNVDEDVWRA